MTEEQLEFKKEVDEKLQSIYSKINKDEKIFLSYLVNQFNLICKRNDKAIEWANMHDIDDCWELLKILKGEDNEK